MTKIKLLQANATTTQCPALVGLARLSARPISSRVCADQQTQTDSTADMSMQMVGTAKQESTSVAKRCVNLVTINSLSSNSLKICNTDKIRNRQQAHEMPNGI